MAGSDLLVRLAARVRGRRHELGLTVRELAASSGLSERFLVSLEGGAANVSVTRLDDVARALGSSASALLAEGPLEPGAGARPASTQVGLVALLGLRGAGKSTIGRLAAGKLAVPFIELDERVAARAGLSLGQIFEIHGADYYRRLEREELQRLATSGAPGVVATSGGIVADRATFALLRREARTIWLKAKPQDHWGRVVAQGDARPMADRSDAMNELRALLRARRALYEQADHVVDTSALGLEKAVDRVVKLARGPAPSGA